MITYVVDANIAAKWLLPATDEPFSAEALELLRGYTDGDLRFLVPDLFWAELGNVLWKSVRFKRISHTSAEAGLRATRERDFPTVPCRTLLEAAFVISCTFDRSLYDATYLALALQSKSQMVTADEHLANAVAAHLPVKWLGAI